MWGRLLTYVVDRAGPAAVVAAIAAFCLSIMFDSYLDARRARDELRGELFTIIENVTRIGLWPLADDRIEDGSRRAHIDLYTKAAAALATFERRAPLEDYPLEGTRSQALAQVHDYISNTVNDVVAAHPLLNDTTEDGARRSRFRVVHDTFPKYREIILQDLMPGRITFTGHLWSVLQQKGVMPTLIVALVLIGIGVAYRRRHTTAPQMQPPTPDVPSGEDSRG